MPTFGEWLLWLHVSAGVVAVLAGSGALLTEKGGRRHRRAGRWFLVSVGVVVGTAFGLAAVDPTSFRLILGLVAVFSGYLAFSGYRALSRKRPAATADRVDWIAAGGVAAACLGLAVWGGMWTLDGVPFGIVMSVFGGIGVAFGAMDLLSFLRGESGEWLVSHLQRMIAAFIAMISAVSAVNLTPVLGIAAWLWPTVLGTPLIYYWSKRHSGD